MLGPARELRAQLRLLRGDADGAAVEVAVAALDAPERDKHRGAEGELVRAEQRADHDVAAGAELTVDLEPHAGAQVVLHERLVRLGEAGLPRDAGVLDGGERRGAGAAVEARDHDDVRVRLGDAGGDGPDARLAHELHRDARAGVGAAQVVDELREVLDRVDVVVRRRRDERGAGLGVAQARDEGVDLARRELPALAGLGALRDLDLQVLRAAQVTDRDAEPPRGDLLDRAVAVGPEALRILAPLAAVGHRAEAVERERDRLVRLGRERAERHRAADEVPHDLLDGLDLVERDRRALAKREARPQRDAAVVVDGVGVAVEARVVAGAHRLAEVRDALRRPEVLLAVLAEAVLAARREDGGRVRGPRLGEAALDVLELEPADGRGDAGEVFADELRAESDGFEDARAAVGAQRRDAHLGHDLHQALAHRADVVRGGLDGIGPADLGDGRQREPRVHRRRAEAEQHGEVVHLAHLARFHDDADRRPHARLGERLVHGGDGQKGGDPATGRPPAGPRRIRWRTLCALCVLCVRKILCALCVLCVR